MPRRTRTLQSLHTTRATRAPDPPSLAGVTPPSEGPATPAGPSPKAAPAPPAPPPDGLDAGRPDDARRQALARGVIELLRSALPDGSGLDVALGGGGAGSPAASPPVAPATLEAGTPVMSIPARTRVIVRDPDAVGRLLLPPSPDGLADGYLRGDLDIEGDVRYAVEAGESLDLRSLGPTGARRLLRWGLELRRGAGAPPPLRRVSRMAGRRHSRARDLAAVRFHYDVGNAFFALWLDRRLAYSCAYFPDGTTAETAPTLLDVAQEAKLDLIARKLRLAPDSRLLDIGCGWGSLVNFAGERYHCRAVGVTLSELQATEANARAIESGLGDRVRAEVRDYRDLAPLGSFDAIGSVGMFEHVGRANLPTYFGAAFRALAPGGLFLNHGIAQASRPERTGDGGGWNGRGRGRSRFVDRYVFPDGELVPVEEAVAQARAAGFEVLDLQSLRPHYALTLAAWVARLEANWDAALAAAGEEVARTWRLYMAAAHMGFERGDLDVVQLLLARPDGPRPSPRSLRPWW